MGRQVVGAILVIRMKQGEELPKRGTDFYHEGVRKRTTVSEVRHGGIAVDNQGKEEQRYWSCAAAYAIGLPTPTTVPPSSLTQGLSATKV